MMNAIKYTNDLQAAKFTRKQAQATVRVLYDLLEQNLATKKDIHELDQRIHELDLKLRHEIEASGFKLTIKLGAMLALSITILASLIKLF